MWLTGYINPMSPLFIAAKAAASNVPQSGERGNYTEEMFQKDFPQFTKRNLPDAENNPSVTEEDLPDAGDGLSDGKIPIPVSLVPETMLKMFIEQANDSVLPSRWGSMWRYAAGLYTAHFCALYLKPYASGSDSIMQAAIGADQTGVIKSATMGDTSISYDNSAITSGTEKWGTWNATQYGSQLITMARMVGMGGMYGI